METIIICSELLKILMVSLLTYFVYIKITNYKENDLYKNIFILIWSINNSLLFVILNKYIYSLTVIIFLFSIYGLLIEYIIKKDYTIIGYIFSCVMAYVIYLISIIMSGILLLFLRNRDYMTPKSLLTIPSMSILLFWFIFKRKRLKNGFNFLKNNNSNKSIRNYIIFSIGAIIIISGFLLKMNSILLRRSVLIGSVLIMISIFTWIKSEITKTYKTKMRDRTIEIQKAEIDEKSQMIEEIKTENLKLATAIHKYNHKFEALEHAMKNALNSGSKTEFAEELSVILEDMKETSKNFAEATKINIVKLAETNIPGIDNMFKYMQEEARKNNINFDLKVNASISPLIDNIIPKEKFEILIGDHLKDAIIAVKSSEKSYKSILAILGLVDGVYELSIYDTGIEFEIDTLLKLGKEQVTTHKEIGGSGIGFMTTFETLKDCKGSLIIEEYNPETTSYTKSVTIRFDGKNKYKICSYRAEKIKEQKTKRRIIIQKLK